MTTAQILTKNNEKTIRQTLESIVADQILVADLGSTDDTLSICLEFGAHIWEMDLPRNEARNFLVDVGEGNDWNFFIEPWEFMVKGHRLINRCNGENRYASILNNKLLSKEIRFWKGKHHKFQNPVYERLNVTCNQEIDVVFYSTGRDYEDAMERIQQWKKDHPTSVSPWYYEACTLLAQGKWDRFLSVSEHYMSLDPSTSMSSIMNRYYYALAQVIRKKRVRPALQNLALCLSEKPLMAEFWCLMGDVFYHLVNDWGRAMEFYGNAIILGRRRLKTDVWPMDLTKYKSYPEKMIESCKMLQKSTTAYYIKREV